METIENRHRAPSQANLIVFAVFHIKSSNYFNNPLTMPCIHSPNNICIQHIYHSFTYKMEQITVNFSHWNLRPNKMKKKNAQMSKELVNEKKARKQIDEKIFI